MNVIKKRELTIFDFELKRTGLDVNSALFLSLMHRIACSSSYTAFYDGFLTVSLFFVSYSLSWFGKVYTRNEMTSKLLEYMGIINQEFSFCFSSSCCFFLPLAL
jgi:hypothetical protein